MAIAFSNLGSSANPDLNNSSNATSYSTASWTPDTSGLVIVFVHARGASVGAAVAPTVSGNSLTWTQIASVIRSADRLTLFAANLSGATSGTTTFDFGSDGQLNCTAAFMRATGVDLSGGVAAAFVQSPTNNSNTITASVTLSSAGSSDNRPVAGFWHDKNEGAAPRTDWTEFDQLNGTGPTRVLETQVREGAFETTASVTWDNAGSWAAIAAELKAAASGSTYNESLALSASAAATMGAQVSLSDALSLSASAAVAYVSALVFNTYDETLSLAAEAGLVSAGAVTVLTDLGLTAQAAMSDGGQHTAQTELVFGGAAAQTQSASLSIAALLTLAAQSALALTSSTDGTAYDEDAALAAQAALTLLTHLARWGELSLSAQASILESAQMTWSGALGLAGSADMATSAGMSYTEPLDAAAIASLALSALPILSDGIDLSAQASHTYVSGLDGGSDLSMAANAGMEMTAQAIYGAALVLAGQASDVISGRTEDTSTTIAMRGASSPH